MLSLLAVAALAITGCSSNKETQEALADCAGAIATRYNAEVENSPSFIDFLSAEAADNNINVSIGFSDSAVDYLLQHPEIKHGKIRIAFNPDEEIGQGAHKFDVEHFGADWAYTMDGGAVGELEYENFNAAVARVTFNGRNVHPGYAKHKMINSMRIANQFVIMLPRWETPEHTEDYEGFYHLVSMEGTVEKSVLTYIIRDHDRDRFERRKKELEHLTRKINHEFPDCCSIEIKDQYYNMREKIEPAMHVVDYARQAMKLAGVEPKVQPIRGGTDGAQLSFKGLPCPNIFAGGLNFHGRYEFVPVPSMEKATKVIVEIARLVANDKK